MGSDVLPILVSWSLTSPFSTNMASSETKKVRGGKLSLPSEERPAKTERKQVKQITKNREKNLKRAKDKEVNKQGWRKGGKGVSSPTRGVLPVIQPTVSKH